jgi:nitrogen fixation protein
VKSTTVTADNNWVYSFPDMPKYTSDGKKIKYSIDEDSVSGYTRTVNGYTVVNTHLPADKPGTSGREISGSQASENTGTINISGTKTWVDSNNAEKKRPDYIIVHLFADGIEKRVTTVTESNGWAYSFPNMPKTNESGSPVKYTVDEDDVSGYKKTVTGYNIINTLNSLAGSEEEKEALEKAEKESSQKDSAVQTGDKAPVAIMIAILGSAAAVIAGCFIKARRKSGKQKSDDDLIWLE